MQSNEYYLQIFHEIKNSVALIEGYLQLLEKKLPELEQSEYFNTIKKEAARLRKMATEFSQLRFGKNLSFACTDLRNFLTDCCNHIHSLGNPMQLHFQLSLPEIPLWVSIDSRQLHHAILNLLKNSCEAMNYQGTIFVSAFAENSDVYIRIKDSGPGLPPELLDYLFDPFTTTKEDGSGLGLTIAKQIISAHNGSITVDPASQKGCTFIIKLPRLSKYENMV